MHIIVEIDWHFSVNFLFVYQRLRLVTPGDKNQDTCLSHLVILEYQAQKKIKSEIPDMDVSQETMSQIVKATLVQKSLLKFVDRNFPDCWRVWGNCSC